MSGATRREFLVGAAAVALAPALAKIPAARAAPAVCPPVVWPHVCPPLACDGVTDDTAAMQCRIDHGGTIRLERTGPMLVSAPLVFSDKATTIVGGYWQSKTGFVFKRSEDVAPHEIRYGMFEVLKPPVWPPALGLS